jgi:hypothetical protein
MRNPVSPNKLIRVTEATCLREGVSAHRLRSTQWEESFLKTPNPAVNRTLRDEAAQRRLLLR